MGRVAKIPTIALPQRYLRMLAVLSEKPRGHLRMWRQQEDEVPNTLATAFPS